MAFKRPGLEAHRENVDTVKSLYLKSDDFKEQRRFRPLPWVYNGDPIDILTYQEGWHIPDEIDQKTKKLKYPNGRPVRFPAEMKPDEFPPLNWKEESFGDSKPRKKTPGSAISMLVWDYKSASIKIVSFAQKSVLKPINEYLSEFNEDGSRNETYVENLTSVDFIVKKIDDRTWNINIKEGNPKIPLEAWKELGSFTFSWENFMETNSDMDNAHTLADFVEAIEGQVEVETPEEQKKRLDKQNANKPTPTNKVTNKEQPATSNKEVAKPAAQPVEAKATSWRDVTTSKGKKIGEYTLDQLQKTKDWFESEKKDSFHKSPIYAAVVEGIKELSPPKENPDEFLPEEEDVPWGE